MEPIKSYLLPIIAEPSSLIPLVTMGRDYRAIDNKKKWVLSQFSFEAV